MQPMEFYLPDHVLVLILLNYTVMQLMRMKCVSQRWRHLIESDYFVRLHFQANRNNSDYFLATYPLFEEPFSRLSIIRSETLSLHSVVDVRPRIFNFPPSMSWSTHGLVGFFIYTDIILCNPATRTFNKIPDVVQYLANYVEADGVTRKAKRFKGWNGFATVRTIGLGCSPVTNEFKIFAFVQVDRTLTTCVYNFTSGTWLRLDYKYPHLSGEGVPCNGVLHWTARPRNGRFQPTEPTDIHLSRYSIVTCDVTTNEFGEMELPRGVLGNNLGLVNGSLAVFERVTNELYGAHVWCIDVWSMPDYGVEESWAQLYRVGPLGYNHCLFYWRDRALLCGSDHYNEDHRFEEELVSCDINQRIIGRLRIYFKHIQPYKESLISVDQPTI